MSWGLAGGLDPALSAGTIAMPAVLMLGGAPDARDLRADSAWCERVGAVLAARDSRSGKRVPVEAGGKLLTSRRPLASAAEKRKAFVDTGAIAVDMESYAIASVATARGLPFVAIRVIVDGSGDDVPSILLDVAGSRGRIAAGHLLVRMLASPRSLAPLLRLARRYRVARRSLREAARVFGR